MSEFEKMRAGEIYNPRDLKLIYMYGKTAGVCIGIIKGVFMYIICEAA